MPQLSCPTCRRRFSPASSPALPFCSERCRQIDLARWLDEEHRLPVYRDPEEDDDAAYSNDEPSE